MRSSRQESSLVPSAAPLGSMIIVACHDDHQKVKGFLPKHGSWDIVLHLMRNGSAMHIVATWRVLTSGVNAPFVWLLGFSLIFSFLCLVFKLLFFPLSPSLFPTLSQSLLCSSSSLSCSALWFSWAFAFYGCFLWGMSLFPPFLLFIV